MFNKNNKREISAVEDLIAGKVYVTAERLAALQELAKAVWAPEAPPPPPCSILCINLRPEVEAALRKDLGPECSLLVGGADTAATCVRRLTGQATGTG